MAIKEIAADIVQLTFKNSREKRYLKFIDPDLVNGQD